MSFQLSPDQDSAVAGILNTLLHPGSGDHSLAVLTGSAGTGKTTVIKEIIRVLEDTHPCTKVELAASTHRAAKVLSDIVNMPVATGHNIFKLRPTIGAGGKESLKSTGVCAVPMGAIVIIDEASMIGNKFLAAIVDTIKLLRLNVLFVGDPFQLPPPGDTCSLFDGSLPTYTLTQVHRQAGGNPILEKANEFREFIEGIRKEEPLINTDINAKGEGIHVLPHADFITQFVQKYVNYNAGTEIDIPLCTFTNESAINYNSMIRKAAYFLEDSIQPFYVGEQLISNAIVMKGRITLLANNESVIVQGWGAHTHEGIPGYAVRVKGTYIEKTRTAVKEVFCPQSKIIADKGLKEIKAKAIHGEVPWSQFYELKQYMADLRPPFAGTTHKAQGGTFPAVFIDKVNINKCRDPRTKARLLYVALTRASNHVYINS